jgi:hypothetical protein
MSCNRHAHPPSIHASQAIVPWVAPTSQPRGLHGLDLRPHDRSPVLLHRTLRLQCVDAKRGVVAGGSIACPAVATSLALLRWAEGEDRAGLVGGRKKYWPFIIKGYIDLRRWYR